MIDIILLVSGVIGIIEKTRNLLKGIQGRSRKRSEEIKKKAYNLLQDVSQLINKFSESVDLVLKMLEKSAPLGYYDNTAKLYQANRRLFEISSEMRILTKSISKKFHGAELSEIKQVANLCLQIVFIENFVSVMLAKGNQFNKLPLKPSVEGYMALWQEGFMQKMEELPFSLQHNGYIRNQIAYFNNILIQLTRCKEKLAIALQDLT